MACISKLANAIAHDCDSGATGLVSALIINKADISSFTVDGAKGYLSALTLEPWAKVYKIDTVKRSITASMSLKINEGAPNAYTHTVNLTVMEARGTDANGAISAALSNGSFVVLAVHAGRPAERPAVYGLYYGLSATSAERNSHDNGGWATYTLETPENVIGEDNLYAGSAVYKSLFDAAVG